MKNIMRKVLALGVAAAMMLSTATAFAADGMDVSMSVEPASKAEVSDLADRSFSESANLPAFGKMAAGAKTVKSSSYVKVWTVNDEATLGTINADDIEDYTNLEISGNSGYDVFLVKPSATGKLWFNAGVYADSKAPVDIIFGTYQSSTNSITNLPQKTWSIEVSSAYSNMGCIDVKANTTYCFGVHSDQQAFVGLLPYVFPYSERLLTQNKWMVSSGVKGSNNAISTITYKVVAPKSGYMDVYLDAVGKSANTTGSVTLLNKNRKVVSSTLSYNRAKKTGYVVFGVKKGATYYIKVANCYGTAAERAIYGVKYIVTKGKIRANTKRSKSIKLKRKAKYTVTTAPAKTKGGKDWYKFKVTKKRKTQVRIDATNVKSGTMKVTCYAGKKKIATKTVVKGKVNTFTITHSTTYGKANRGTYYIVIQKSAKMNGQYRIKYLK